MSPWFSKSLGDGILAWEPMHDIAERFAAAYATPPGPVDEAAVFVRHESDRRLHCEVRVFFSPASVALAREVDATPCPRPSPDGLRMLAGADHAWSTLFPERKR